MGYTFFVHEQLHLHNNSWEEKHFAYIYLRSIKRGQHGKRVRTGQYTSVSTSVFSIGNNHKKIINRKEPEDVSKDDKHLTQKRSRGQN
jgi:hypothetical protein